MKRASLVVGLALAVIGGAGACLFALRGRPPRVEGVVASEPTRGAVVICLDTLRADALSLDSGRPVVMPRLEAFARESVAFADATAPSAWTGPSITSLLTGLDPSHTGVVGLPERIGNLSSAVRTLSERLASAGWHTGAITTGAWLTPGTSALRGTEVGLRELDRDPEGVISRWNARRTPGAPCFLFLHTLAAHDPYLDKELDDNAAAPSADAFRTVDEVRARAIAKEVADGAMPSDADLRWSIEIILGSGAHRARLRTIIGPAPLDALFGILQRWLDDRGERDPEIVSLGARLRAAYVESLATVDRLIGRILDALAAQPMPERTVVIVVADHGESFGEHKTLLHGRRLYDELLRVPFLVKGAARLGTPRVVRGDVGLVDVVPTVLSLAGLPTAPGLDGIDLVAATTGRSVLAERTMRAFDERRRFVDGVERIEGLESVRTTRAKCIVRRDAVTRRIIAADVFDLAADPLEAHPIPFGKLERPCGFGDAFARAMKDLGLPITCLAEK